MKKYFSFTDDIEVISSKDAAKFPIMASITLFSIYMCYKFFADKMYYLVTGYFFLLGVAAVTAIFEPLVAPKLTFLFPGLHPDADYELNFFENKKKQFDLKFNRRSECSKKFLLTNFCIEKISSLDTIIRPIIFFSKNRLTSFYEILLSRLPNCQISQTICKSNRINSFSAQKKT